jgi:hypothetical protein
MEYNKVPLNSNFINQNKIQPKSNIKSLISINVSTHSQLISSDPSQKFNIKPYSYLKYFKN